MKNLILLGVNIFLLILIIKLLKRDSKCLSIFRNRKNERYVFSGENIINTLCYNTNEGRRVGSRGNEKTVEYIREIFEELKLVPLFNDSYYQKYNQDVLLKKSEEDDEGEVVNKSVKNVIGKISGSENDRRAVVISAHLDSVGSINSRIIKGALDNASGIAVLIKIAENLVKENNFNKDIVFACFNGEETGLQGSRYFVDSIVGKYKNIYNINIDCVCGKSAGMVSLENSSKISEKLTSHMKMCFTRNNMEFSNTAHNEGTSDHKSFEDAKIPNIYIGQDKAKLYIHNYYDTPDSIDFDKIDALALCISDFIIKNDNITF